MSSGKSKEEEELLDQKIARIRKKNEEILRRRQEIEEDKKLAEQQNAMVKLRPSTDDWPRERMPALRPSQRDLKAGGDGDFMNDYPEPADRNRERSNRGILASRGRENVGRGCAPPPDPVSFLADPERDLSDEREASSFVRGAGRNFREFKRDGPRRGNRDRGRGQRGRGFHSHQGPHSSMNDDAWREERHRIDEARINRQKSADGRWKREWDNEKVNLETEDEPVEPSYTATTGVGSRLDRWKHQSRGTHDSSDFCEQPIFRGRGSGGPTRRGSRGARGSYQIFPENSPPLNRGGRGASLNVNMTTPKYSSASPLSSNENFSTSHQTQPIRQKKSFYSMSPTPKVMPSVDSHRIVTNFGDSYKVVVPNTGAVSSAHVKKEKEPFKHTSRKGHFQQHQQHVLSEKGYRSRLSQSQSSYSEDENPHKSDHEIKLHNRGTKSYKQPNSTNTISSKQNKSSVDANLEKPPLPPFKTSLPKSANNIKIPKDVDDGEGSWEDVTTSGTESIGDDCTFFSSSPYKLDETACLNYSRSDTNFHFNTQNNERDQADVYTPDDFIQLVRPGVGTIYDETTNEYNNKSDMLLPSNVSDESYLETTSSNCNLHLNESDKMTDDVSDILQDPKDIYSPDDFIQLVPPVNKSAIENISENHSVALSFEKKEINENNSPDILKDATNSEQTIEHIQFVLSNVGSSQMDNPCLFNENKIVQDSTVTSSNNISETQAKIQKEINVTSNITLLDCKIDTQDVNADVLTSNLDKNNEMKADKDLIETKEITSNETMLLSNSGNDVAFIGVPNQSDFSNEENEVLTSKQYSSSDTLLTS